MKKRNILLLGAALLLSSFMILQFGCKKDKDDEPNPPTPPTYTNGQGEIGSIGGIVMIDDPGSPIDGSYVSIPEGALGSNKQIEVTYDPDQKCVFDSTSIIVKFEPSGLTFNKQVEIGIPYESGVDTSELKVFYYDTENETFHQLTVTGINVSDKIIKASTDHFSGFMSTTKYVRIYTELVKVNGTLGALVEITSEQYGQDEGLHLIYTLPDIWILTNYWSARDIINYYEGYEVLSVFKVTLKRKIFLGEDEEIQSKKLIVRRIEHSFGSHGYEVYIDNLNAGNKKYFLNEAEDEQIFETFMQGIPLIFKFDENEFEPNDDHKYYVNIEWALSTDPDAYYISRYTHLYEEDNRKEAKKPTSMINWNKDINNDYVNDEYQEINHHNPIVSTLLVSNITETSAIVTGSVSNLGGSIVTQHGHCWSTSPEPSISDNKTNLGELTQVGNFESVISGLNSSTTYYVRAYAQNSTGTGYGYDKIFTTSGGGSNPPNVVLQTPSGIQSGNITIYYTITDEDGNMNNLAVRYQCPSCGNNPATLVSSSVGTINGSVINNIPPGEHYFVWNSVADYPNNHTDDMKIKMTWEATLGFETETFEVDNTGGSNTPPTAIFTIDPTYGTTSTVFEFDGSDSYDNEDPTSNLQVRWDFDGDGSWDTGWDYDKTENHQYGSEGTYTVKMEVKDTEGLTDYVTHNVTVSNGGGSTFTDPRDGQVYNIVTIGTQTWFAENLNYQTTNSWWYDNSSANGDVYGRLYTWNAALTACPAGWHLPSDDEWCTLTQYIDPTVNCNTTGWSGTDCGYKMKSTSGWYSNGNGSDAYGFTALPGGRRRSSGSFYGLGRYGGWWSSSEYSGTGAWYRLLFYDYDQVCRFSLDKAFGLSVRCLKN